MDKIELIILEICLFVCSIFLIIAILAEIKYYKHYKELKNMFNVYKVPIVYNNNQYYTDIKINYFSEFEESIKCIIYTSKNNKFIKVFSSSGYIDIGDINEYKYEGLARRYL